MWAFSPQSLVMLTTSSSSSPDGSLTWTRSFGRAFSSALAIGERVEHDELFASIRAGTPINNGDYMAKSTLLAIMGRMATYTGQEITWEMAWNSQENLSPPHYQWGELATPAVAVPGVTKFV